MNMDVNAGRCCHWKCDGSYWRVFNLVFCCIWSSSWDAKQSTRNEGWVAALTSRWGWGAGGRRWEWEESQDARVVRHSKHPRSKRVTTGPFPAAISTKSSAGFIITVGSRETEAGASCYAADGDGAGRWLEVGWCQTLAHTAHVRAPAMCSKREDANFRWA